jgi:hypothetical protein
MDKPTTPSGGDAVNPLWRQDSGSDDSFGATGVFGVVNVPDKPASADPAPLKFPPAAPPPVSAWQRVEAAWPPPPPMVQAPPPPPAAAPAAPPARVPASPPTIPLTSVSLTEPVVHKVVVGGPADDDSTQLLNRIRMVSAERAPLVERAPLAGPGSAAPGVQGSGGFTELLRTLSTDSAAPAATALVPPAAERPAGAPMAGFTSLLQTLNAADLAQGKPAVPAQREPEPAWQPQPDPARSQPEPAAQRQPEPNGQPALPAQPYVQPAPSPGGFTELLRMSDMGVPQAQATGIWAPPAAAATHLPETSKPGSFTQLFGNYPGTMTPGPPPTDRAPESSPGGLESFTKMLRLDQSEAPAKPAYREEPKPLPGRFDYGEAPDKPTSASAAPAADPFANPVPETLPPPPASAAGNVGITRLIQMLEEPSREPVPQYEPPPPRASAAAPGAWTQMFESPAKSAPEPAKAQSWPPPAPTAPPAYVPPPVAAPAPSFAPPAASGPSEFTRILDASRMREMALRGGSPVENPAGEAVPQGAAPAMPKPSFTPPAMPGRPAAPAMPQAGAMAPRPQMPAMPPMAPPQMPAVKVPQMTAPQLPAAKLPDAPKGLQAYVPVLLVAIIVLLLVLIVTVIFLMKH